MNKLNESVLSGFHYVPPKDPEQRMMDFYFVSGYIFRDSVEKYPGKDEEKENMNFEVSNMFVALQKHLIDVVRFSLACEFRHLLDGIVQRPKSVLLAMSPEQKEFVYEYSLYMQAKKGPLDNPLIPSRDSGLDRPIFRIEKKENEKIRRKSYTMLRKAQKKLGLSDADLGAIFAIVFDSNIAQWNSGYGGDKWKAIAIGWTRLVNAKNTNDRMVMIDHVYDLQHNTNTVFNKLSSYIKNGGYSWVLKALDWKKEHRSANAFLQRISPQWRSVWTSFKGYEGETEEGTLAQAEKWKKDAKKIFKKNSFIVKKDIFKQLPLAVGVSDEKELKQLGTILKYFGLSTMKELEKAFNIYKDSRYVIAHIYKDNNDLLIADAETVSKGNAYSLQSAVSMQNNITYKYSTIDDFKQAFITDKDVKDQAPTVIIDSNEKDYTQTELNNEEKANLTAPDSNTSSSKDTDVFNNFKYAMQNLDKFPIADNNEYYGIGVYLETVEQANKVADILYNELRQKMVVYGTIQANLRGAKDTIKQLYNAKEFPLILTAKKDKYNLLFNVGSEYPFEKIQQQYKNSNLYIVNKFNDFKDLNIREKRSKFATFVPYNHVSTAFVSIKDHFKDFNIATHDYALAYDALSTVDKTSGKYNGIYFLFDFENKKINFLEALGIDISNDYVKYPQTQDGEIYRINKGNDILGSLYSLYDRYQNKINGTIEPTKENEKPADKGFISETFAMKIPALDIMKFIEYVKDNGGFEYDADKVKNIYDKAQQGQIQNVGTIVSIEKKRVYFISEQTFDKQVVYNNVSSPEQGNGMQFYVGASPEPALNDKYLPIKEYNPSDYE